MKGPHRGSRRSTARGAIRRRSAIRGASILEYLLLVGSVALIALGLLRVFGGTVKQKISGQGDIVGEALAIAGLVLFGVVMFKGRRTAKNSAPG
jgi:hypothetical protein